MSTLSNEKINSLVYYTVEIGVVLVVELRLTVIILTLLGILRWGIRS